MIKLILENSGSLGFVPGQKVSGSVQWLSDKPLSVMEVRLFWYTSGKGDSDIEIACAHKLMDVGVSGENMFSFTIPALGPYSFSGKLISLIWAIEVVGEPSTEVQRVTIVVSPTGSEFILSGEGK